MNIDILEAERHSEFSVCCGDNFYPDLPIAEVHDRIRSRANSMPCQIVAVYCITCVKAISFGGKTPRYVLDLLFGEATEPGYYDTELWRKQIQAYMDSN